MLRNPHVQILMADDDEDDRMLMKEALQENAFLNPISFVENGEDLLDYLNQRGKYLLDTPALPGLILLDLICQRLED